MISKNHTFVSKRLRYRGITLDDAEKIVGWRSEPDNYRYFFSGRPTIMKEHIEWFKRYMSDCSRFDFMISDLSGHRIGIVWLSDIVNDSCEVSYIIGEKESRNHGYATEAIQAICEMARKELGIVRFIARILPENIASQKTAEKAGFVEKERVFTCILDN